MVTGITSKFAKAETRASAKKMTRITVQQNATCRNNNGGCHVGLKGDGVACLVVIGKYIIFDSMTKWAEM